MNQAQTLAKKLRQIDTTDEQAMTDLFIQTVGSIQRADQLMSIWKDSYAFGGSYIFEWHTKEDVFNRKAEAAGFTQPEIGLFLRLQ